jgi:hypothetical protein
VTGIRFAIWSGDAAVELQLNLFEREAVKDYVFSVSDGRTVTVSGLLRAYTLGLGVRASHSPVTSIAVTAPLWRSNAESPTGPTIWKTPATASVGSLSFARAMRRGNQARLRPSIALPSIIGICASRSLDATQYHAQHASPSSRKSVS